MFWQVHYMLYTYVTFVHTNVTQRWQTWIWQNNDKIRFYTWMKCASKYQHFYFVTSYNLITLDSFKLPYIKQLKLSPYLNNIVMNFFKNNECTSSGCTCYFQMDLRNVGCYWLTWIQTHNLRWWHLFVVVL